MRWAIRYGRRAGRAECEDGGDGRQRASPVTDFGYKTNRGRWHFDLSCLLSSSSRFLPFSGSDSLPFPFSLPPRRPPHNPLLVVLDGLDPLALDLYHLLSPVSQRRHDFDASTSLRISRKCLLPLSSPRTAPTTRFGSSTHIRLHVPGILPLSQHASSSPKLT